MSVDPPCQRTFSGVLRNKIGHIVLHSVRTHVDECSYSCSYWTLFACQNFRKHQKIFYPTTLQPYSNNIGHIDLHSLRTHPHARSYSCSYWTLFARQNIRKHQKIFYPITLQLAQQGLSQHLIIFLRDLIEHCLTVSGTMRKTALHATRRTFLDLPTTNRLSTRTKRIRFFPFRYTIANSFLSRFKQQESSKRQRFKQQSIQRNI
mmetsp:Transcript_11565/g.18807  ORF Transcript_11565/g.18807 Transcript_11565/m.18807 type:complete len:205 (-) Transcript_11565:185-799(-)